MLREHNLKVEAKLIKGVFFGADLERYKRILSDKEQIPKIKDKRRRDAVADLLNLESRLLWSSDDERRTLFPAFQRLCPGFEGGLIEKELIGRTEDLISKAKMGDIQSILTTPGAFLPRDAYSANLPTGAVSLSNTTRHKHTVQIPTVKGMEKVEKAEVVFETVGGWFALPEDDEDTTDGKIRIPTSLQRSFDIPLAMGDATVFNQPLKEGEYFRIKVLSSYFDQMTGKSNGRQAWLNFIKDLYLLQRLGVGAELREEGTTLRTFNLIQHLDVKKDSVEIFLGAAYSEILAKKYIEGHKSRVYLPPNSFNIDLNRHSISYTLLKFLATHKSQNLSKKNFNRVKVERILWRLGGFITAKDKRADQKHWKRDIWRPIKRELDYLVEKGCLVGYRFFNPGSLFEMGEPKKFSDLETATLEFLLPEPPAGDVISADISQENALKGVSYAEEMDKQAAKYGRRLVKVGKTGKNDVKIRETKGQK